MITLDAERLNAIRAAFKGADPSAKAKVKSRIVMTPEHAKRLAMALQDNLMRYEAQFGEIRLPERGGYAPNAPFKVEA